MDFGVDWEINLPLEKIRRRQLEKQVGKKSDSVIGFCQKLCFGGFEEQRFYRRLRNVEVFVCFVRSRQIFHGEDNEYVNLEYVWGTVALLALNDLFQSGKFWLLKEFTFECFIIHIYRILGRFSVLSWTFCF